MLTFYTVDNYVWFIFTVPIWYCRNLPHWNFVSYQCAAARGGQFFYDIVYPIVEIHCRRRRQKFNDSTISVTLTLKIYCRRRRQKKIRIWSKPCARILSLSASLVPPGGWGGPFQTLAVGTFIQVFLAVGALCVTTHSKAEFRYPVALLSTANPLYTL